MHLNEMSYLCVASGNLAKDVTLVNLCLSCPQSRIGDVICSAESREDRIRMGGSNPYASTLRRLQKQATV